MGQEFQYLAAGGSIIRLFGVGDAPPYRLAVDIGDGVDIVLTESDLHIGVVTIDMTGSDGTNTRPANTTAYTANDCMSDNTAAPHVVTFANVSRVRGWGGWVINAFAVDSANQATKPQLRLFLFTVAPAATNDNAAFTVTDAELLNCIGTIDFNNWVAGDDTAGANGNSVCTPVLNQPIPFVCANGDNQLYGKIKVLNAYTPVSGEVVTFRLGIEQE